MPIEQKPAGYRVEPRPMLNLSDLEESIKQFPTIVAEELQALFEPNVFVSFYQLQAATSLEVFLNTAMVEQAFPEQEREIMRMQLLEIRTRSEILRNAIILAGIVASRVDSLLQFLQSDPNYQTVSQMLSHLICHNSSDQAFGRQYFEESDQMEEIEGVFDQYKDQFGLSRFSLAETMCAIRLKVGEGTLSDAEHFLCISFSGTTEHEVSLYLHEDRQSEIDG